TQLLPFGCFDGKRKIIGSDLEAPHHTLQAPRRFRSQTEILQCETKAGMIRNRKKDDHRYFSIQTPSIQISVKIDPRSHESRPKAECPAEIIGREHSVVDALQAHSIVFDGHADDSFIGVYILPKVGRQDVLRTMTLAFCRTERLETCGNDGGVRFNLQTANCARLAPEN